MSEQTMIDLVAEALRASGIEDELIAVGQFYPRGHTGGMFAGGMVGSDAGGRLGGGIGGDVGMAAGSLAGMRAADGASGLPSKMLVGVSANTVYGLDAPTRHSPPRAIVFTVSRSKLEAKVHQRVNVRVLELIDTDSGAKLELEGNRLGVTHSGDVIKALTG
jgi:hypothetical protein